MRFNEVLILAAASLTLTSPASHAPYGRLPGHVVHEKRSVSAGAWQKREPANPNARLPLRIGLKQRNLDRMDEFINEVSSPFSDKYGQHWSAKEVVEMFAPRDESISAVKAWLANSGIDPSQVKLLSTKSWITVNLTIEAAESLLQTKYHIYEHETGQLHVAAESYSLPAHLSKNHIDIVIPTVHFDVKLPSQGGIRRPHAATKREVDGIAKTIGQPSDPGSVPKMGAKLHPWNIITELEKCDEQIVPDCLRALYSFGPGISAQEGNSYGIVEYSPQSYLPSDLDLFFANFSKKQVGNRPVFNSIDGGALQTIVESFQFNGESNLDLQYAMALVYPQNVTLYQVGDLVQGASFNNFLNGIDGSYCTFEGGNDPTQDAIYPDPLGGEGAFLGPEECGKFEPAKVISTSYGYNEADLTPFYEQRQCAEYAKLGLMGTTVLYSSGDSGVAGNGQACLGPNGAFVFDSGQFNPGFPSGCPYITSVGATQVLDGTNIIKDLAIGVQPESACETVIFSGGGFSNVFPIPAYQKDAVSSYLTKYPPPYTAAQYNNSGQVRGFPDVSANGANYVVAIDGEFGLIYGTSASSPTFGSVITLINEARYTVGKSSVGFIYPTLYSHAWALNDVTNGTNPGCGTTGFVATSGWDPVTGLGTPNFPKMLRVFMGLP